MNKLFFATSIAILGVLSVAQSAKAVLFINISDNGFNQTRFAFSGSAVATSNSFISTGLTTWSNLSDYVDPSINNVQFNSFVSNTTSIIANGDTRSIDNLYIDHDNTGTTGDDFGIGVDGASDLTFLSGDTVSWSGDIVLNQTFTPFILGTHTPTGFSPGGLDLQLNVSTTSVPFEFSSTMGLVLSLGLFSTHYCWKKRKQKQIDF